MKVVITPEDGESFEPIEWTGVREVGLAGTTYTGVTHRWAVIADKNLLVALLNALVTDVQQHVVRKKPDAVNNRLQRPVAGDQRDDPDQLER